MALLSAIAQAPIRQDLAVTGSINQYGQIQAVGGVNEKIEGFFATCKSKGLTGTQGVVIPKSNIHNLMLREEVIEAVRAGQFHIWPIENVEEGLSLLSSLETGKLQDDGCYPIGTLNYLISSRLMEFSRIMEQKAAGEDRLTKQNDVEME